MKACGVRVLAKDTADMEPNQVIKHFQKKLAELGMTGRLSMAKAKEIKAKRDLDRTFRVSLCAETYRLSAGEMADLAGDSDKQIDLSAARTTRGKAKPAPRMKKQAPLVLDTIGGVSSSGDEAPRKSVDHDDVDSSAQKVKKGRILEPSSSSEEEDEEAAAEFERREKRKDKQALKNARVRNERSSRAN